MKKVIFLLMLIPFLSFGKKIVKVEYIEKDTLTQGDRTYISLSYDPSEFSVGDTIRIKLWNYQSFQLIEILKISVRDADTITPKADYTKWLYYSIPADYTTLPGTQLTVNYNYGATTSIGLFIRSIIPDISIKTWSSSADTTQQFFSMMIDYTYHPTNHDILEILIGDSIVYHGVYQKSFVFKIPDFNHSSTCNLTISGWVGYLPLNISKPNHLVSGLFSPIIINQPRQDICYYNEQGVEITKPEYGFYIWKTKNSSGKSFISY